MKISFYDTFIVQNFKNSHFTPNNYKEIVLKIRDKIPHFQHLRYFCLGKVQNNDFHLYFYKGIVLKIRVKISEKSAFMILLLRKV